MSSFLDDELFDKEQAERLASAAPPRQRRHRRRSRRSRASDLANVSAADAKRRGRLKLERNQLSIEAQERLALKKIHREEALEILAYEKQQEAMRQAKLIADIDYERLRRRGRAQLNHEETEESELDETTDELRATAVPEALHRGRDGE
jgi:hypothetical protein